MQPTCIRHTELPHTTKLFSDFLYHFDRVAPFYDHAPQDGGSFQAAAARIDYPVERRAALVSTLGEQNGDSPALEALSRPGTLAVVTGQQVGLFSGPCYTVYKALTAARLARRLTESGIPAAPVFWLATEDHDFAEVNHCWSFDAAHQPVRIEVPGTNPAHQPVGEIRLENPPIDALRQSLRDFPFVDETVEMAAQAYAPGRTFGSAFAALLKRMLAAEGLLYLDPMHPGSRRLAAPLLREALRAGDELTARVLERNRQLIEAGYHAQVHVEAQTSFVFLLEEGRRLVLQRHNGEYLTNGRRFAAAELIDRAEHLSPNALLRPVVQDYMLPTVAYVGGPAELAYLAQSEVIYRLLLGHMPVAVHRQGATLLDARSAKLIERYGLWLADFLHGEEVLRERMAARLVPPALGGVIEDTKSQTGRLLDGMGTALGEFDPTLAAAFQKSRRKISYQLSKIERKAAREALRRNERAAGEAAWLNGLIYPHKHLQERFYSILPFLARHGPDVVARLGAEIRLDCPDHRVIVL